MGKTLALMFPRYRTHRPPALAFSLKGHYKKSTDYPSHSEAANIQRINYKSGTFISHISIELMCFCLEDH